MANNVTSLSMVDRSTFDNMSEDEKYSNIYFVRESTDVTSKMLSLYYGVERQCDVLDITDYVPSGSIDFDNPENNYNIPNGYKVKDKLIMVQQEVTDLFGNTTIFYHTYMWNGEQFLDCFGTPNNVLVCSTLPGNPVQDYVYIDLSTKSLYVFDGQVYINLISQESYATVEYVQDVYNTLLSIIEDMSGGGGAIVGNPLVMTNGVTDSVVGFATEITTE